MTSKDIVLPSADLSYLGSVVGQIVKKVVENPPSGMTPECMHESCPHCEPVSTSSHGFALSPKRSKETDGIGVGVGTSVGDGVAVGAGLGVGVGAGNGVGVGTGVGAGVAVGSVVGVGVGSGVTVGTGDGVAVGSGVGVGVGSGAGACAPNAAVFSFGAAAIWARAAGGWPSNELAAGDLSAASTDDPASV